MNSHSLRIPMKQFSKKRLKRLDSLLQSYVDQYLVGCSILVFKDNNEQHYCQAGFKDIKDARRIERDDIFRIYSMTKVIVCTAMMILVEKGEAYLDDSVSQFLPELEDLDVYVSGDIENMSLEKPKRQMTISDLMTHRAGLTYGSDLTPVHRMVQDKLWMNPNHTSMNSDEIIKISVIFLYTTRQEIIGIIRLQQMCLV